MSKTIASSLGILPTPPYTTPKTALLPNNAADPLLMYGVELEIEGLGGAFTERCVNGINGHEDGSLRNSGYEYITQPMHHRELMYVLNQFFMKNKFTEANYSERCSTHVHANVQDLTIEQVRTILVVYMVFERLLFNWIEGDRYNNIFCVPLHETKASYDVLLNGDMTTWISKWQQWEKYTALNLLPMFHIGTIEFRHMGGTCDLQRINTWTSLIGKMFAWARKNTLDDTLKMLKTLNTTSQYQATLTNIFGEYAGVLMCLTFIQDMEAGVLLLKYGCVEKKPDNDKMSIPKAPNRREIPAGTWDAALNEMTLQQMIQEADNMTRNDGGFIRRNAEVRVAPQPAGAPIPIPAVRNWGRFPGDQLDARPAAIDPLRARNPIRR